jgi:uncharacterized integral membrane protein
MSDRSGQRPGQQAAGTQWKGWALLVLAALALIVILQNSQEVTFNLLFLNTSAPLILLLLIFTLLGVAIGYLAPMVRRDRKNK